MCWLLNKFDVFFRFELFDIRLNNVLLTDSYPIFSIFNEAAKIIISLPGNIRWLYTTSKDNVNPYILCTQKNRMTYLNVLFLMSKLFDHSVNVNTRRNLNIVSHSQQCQQPVAVLVLFKN